jgi:thiamine-monophosphate kinase
MAVMVNASDLAPVGAEPVGILLNETLPPDVDEAFVARLQQGIQDACAACGLHVLGGDTNFSPRMQIAATALGVIKNGEPLTRRGCTAGDRLFTSGRLGLGAAFALAQLRPALRENRAGLHYQPQARLLEGQLLRRFATCCIDTSDGAIPALDELMQLNGVGFRLERPVRELLHPGAALVASEASLPAWTLLAGPHGEFELIFTVPEARCEDLSRAAASRGWHPLEIGVVVGEPGLQLELYGRRTPLDTARVRNLFLEVGGDAEAYIAELLRLDIALRAPHHD